MDFDMFWIMVLLDTFVVKLLCRVRTMFIDVLQEVHGVMCYAKKVSTALGGNTSSIPQILH